MAKRNKPNAKSAVPAESSPGTLSHNPLAALAALRTQLPGGEETVPAEIAPEPPPSAKVAKKKPAPAAVKTSGPATSKAPTSTSSKAPRFPGKLVIRRESKGRAGKTVTRISGLPTLELPALAKEMKKALGCGATVEDNDLLLLGSLVDRAAAWLDKAGVGKLVKGN